ncbi:MAG: polyribonucleotide nucleotidyltransferase [Desulfobacteraceae bacterium IS3]|nr:MAG: polyribonucleotide nucleotidyltransferase [Desulfobacteraceae bacterium IS3]
MEIAFKADVGGRPLSIQTGKLAKQASGAVVVQYGETIVLVTVVASDEMRAGTDFLPLSVEYMEKIYAAGRIPGNYHRREVGRPSEKETLTSRLIDRPVRPLFPKDFFYETQVIATVLSMDQENDPDILAMTGASAALELSDIPFAGPVAGVRVGRIGGQLKINPVIAEWDKCDINIILAGSKNGVVMAEGSGNIVSEAELLEAIFFGHAAIQPLIDLQLKLKEAAGKPKRAIPPVIKDEELIRQIESSAAVKLREAIVIPQKMKRHDRVASIKAEIIGQLGEAYSDRKGEADEIFHGLHRKMCRDLVLKEGLRIDGRKFDEIRPITSEVGILPRPHGSALFTRGETQVLGILTMGSGLDEQRVETLSGEESRPFMLHYNFPPFSVGEVKRLGGPSRRDIGHGGLSTRAVEKVLPAKGEFDYTIRVVSEVMESNGSSSMATVCAASLALMDGGVPIKTPVAGIAMGLMKDEDKIAILSDIIGDEDHNGDMDFKVAGTKDGVTAIQMDIKIHELSREIMGKALEQARAGRLFILEKMQETLSEPRKDISPHAPKMISLKINPDKIRDVIGPGGKIIRSIQSETNTRIEIEDSGMVKIAAASKAEADAALKRIHEIVQEAEVGQIYDGTVVKITDFGAFVQIMPGTDGLVHISELARQRVKKVTDVVKEGDRLKVKVLEIRKDGKISLSHRATLEEEKKS